MKVVLSMRGDRIAMISDTCLQLALQLGGN